MTYRLGLIVLIAFLLPFGVRAEAGNVVTRTGEVRDDVYLAGGTVSVDARVDGDVIAAGGQVSIGREVRGDVLAAGGTVNVRGTVADDVRVAGGNVNLEGRIGSDAVAAGGSVELAPEARVGGRAWLAGGNVTVAGRVGHELRVSAQHVTIGGQVDGDVRLMAGEVEILPGARIAGDLFYESPAEARIDPGARIGGDVRFQRQAWEPPAQKARAIGRLVLYASLAVSAIVLYLLFPGFSRDTAGTVRAHPWLSLGTGFVALFIVPIAAVVLMATVLGLPLGFVLLALYLPYLLAGFLMGVLFVVNSAAGVWRREGQRAWVIGGILLAFLLLALLERIPLLGPLVLVAAFLIGLGGLTLNLFRRHAQPPTGEGAA